MQRVQSALPRPAGRPVICIVISCFITASCSKSSGPTEARLSAPRELPAGFVPRWNQSPAQRFELRMGSAQSTPNAPAAARPTGANDAALAAITPSGWTMLEPTSMRAANWQVAGDKRAECYLTLLAGDAGGLAANVNRWRTQMGLGPQTREELERAERIELLGGAAVFVDFEGSFSGMAPTGANTSAQADFRLVGALRIDPQGSAFLKMTGPSDVIAEQVEAFKQLARALGQPRATAQPHAAASEGAHHSLESGSDALTWSAPASWKEAPARPARVVTYYVDAEQEVECYVTSLAGEAGGALANVNRWCKQLNAPEYGDLAELEQLTMLGSPAYLVDVEGTSTPPGATAPQSTRLLGAVSTTPAGSTFVKLVGPPEIVQAQRGALIEFCASLRRSP